MEKLKTRTTSGVVFEGCIFEGVVCGEGAEKDDFGFENYHLHNFKLIDEDLRWVTDGKVQEWKKLIGLVFKNPARDEEIDYWDDDYEGGSAKKYMRSKYTGPRYSKIFEESYPYIRAMVDDMEIDDKNLEDLKNHVQI